MNRVLAPSHSSSEAPEPRLTVEDWKGRSERLHRRAQRAEALLLRTIRKLRVARKDRWSNGPGWAAYIGSHLPDTEP